MQLIISPTGVIRCLYSEELDLKRFGRLTITRGSHVEPDETGQWSADLAPVGGPRLGPFPKRTEALEAERQWLESWLMRR
jgi:hypothetical protein